MKRKLLKQRYILVEYFFILSMLIPSLASAENGGVMSGESLALILVIFSTLFAFVHFCIVTLMRLGNYFKHLWLLRTSLFFSVVSGLIWIISVLSLIGYANEFRHDTFMSFVGLFVVSIIILFLIIYTLKTPVKLYRGTLPNRKIPTGKIPAGIVIISMYSIYSGVSYFFGRLNHQVSFLVSTIPDIQSWLYLLSSGTKLLGFLFFASIYGLWSFQRWGKNLSIGLYVISILLGIISIIFNYQFYPIPYIIFKLLEIGVAGAVILYLKNNKIQGLYNN